MRANLEQRRDALSVKNLPSRKGLNIRHRTRYGMHGYFEYDSEWKDSVGTVAILFCMVFGVPLGLLFVAMAGLGNHWLFFGGFVVAVLLLLWVVDGFVFLCLSYSAENYKLEPTIRNQWCVLWYKRNFLKRLGNGFYVLFRFSKSELERPYNSHCRFLALSLIVCLGWTVYYVVVHLRGASVYTSFFVTVMLVVSLVGVGLFRYALLSSEEEDKSWRIFRKALRLWFFYNYGDRRRPGIWQPRHLNHNRLQRTYLAFSLLWLFMPLSCGFFPIPGFVFEATKPLESSRPALHEAVMWPYEEDYVKLMERIYKGREAKKHVGVPYEGRGVAGLNATILNLRGQSRMVDGWEAEKELEEFEKDFWPHWTKWRQRQNEQELVSTPWRWLVGENGTSGSFTGTLVAIVLCILVPAGSFFCVLFFGSAVPVALHDWQFESNKSPWTKNSVTRWQVYTARLQHSKNPEAKKHIYLGVNHEGDYPVLLPIDALKRHAHIVGSTGSGKTHRAIVPMFRQLVQSEASVLFLDLKGDPGLFNIARLQAQSLKLPFKFYSNVAGADTFAFNPFAQNCISELPPEQKAEWLFTALSFDHGEGYGKAHFSLANLLAPNRLFVNRPEVSSFRAVETGIRELLREAGRSINRLEEEGMGSILGMAQLLAPIDALNVVPGEERFAGLSGDVFENRIRMEHLVKDQGVYYFYLDPSAGSHAQRYIAKLAMYSLIRAAKQNSQGKQVFVFIDEFQQVVSRDMRFALEQARSSNIGVILSNQSFSQLREKDNDFTPVIMDNTQVNMVFSVGDPTYSKMVSEMSGEAIFAVEYVRNLYQKASLVPRNLETERRWEVLPRYAMNDLMHLGADEDLCLVRVVPNMGFCQYNGMPFRIEAEFPFTKRLFQKIEALPWPTAKEFPGAFVPRKESLQPGPAAEPDQSMASTQFEKKLNSLKSPAS